MACIALLGLASPSAYVCMEIFSISEIITAKSRRGSRHRHRERHTWEIPRCHCVLRRKSFIKGGDRERTLNMARKGEKKMTENEALVSKMRKQSVGNESNRWCLRTPGAIGDNRREGDNAEALREEQARKCSRRSLTSNIHVATIRLMNG